MVSMHGVSGALRGPVVAGLVALLVSGCSAASSDPVTEASAAPVAAVADKRPDPAPEADTTHSASLAGVARWEDAEPADLAAETTYALPGVIHADLSLDNLRATFGEANVQLADLGGAEGETFRGAVLFPNDPARRAELFFRNQENRSGVSSVRVRAAQSRWHLANGVRPGMTLAEVVHANGAAVSFLGLDWDYGGRITDWHGGKASPSGASVATSVSLEAQEGASGYPVGDATFRSDDKRYPQQGTRLRVGEVGVAFDD